MSFIRINVPCSIINSLPNSPKLPQGSSTIPRCDFHHYYYLVQNCNLKANRVDQNLQIPLIMNPQQADQFIEFIIIIAVTFALTTISQGALRFLQKKLSDAITKTKTKLDDFFVACLVHTTSWFLFVWYLAALLQLRGKVDLSSNFAKFPLVIVTCIQLIIWGNVLFKNWQDNFANKQKKDVRSSIAALGLLSTSIKIIFIAIVLLVGLSNLGINVGALITGLGIGGIAIALAAQNILGDFLSSLAIVLDKPFSVGDYIVVDKDEGEVEDIGIKTTRVRSISGEELIFSNKDLLESRVRNYKRMWKRRVSHSFNMSFSTPVEKLEALPEQIKKIFAEYDKVKFDRCHCIGIKENYFEFQLVFWVMDPKYGFFMDLQQEILLKIFSLIHQQDIHFGLPAEVVYLKSEKNFSTLKEQSIIENGKSSLNN